MADLQKLNRYYEKLCSVLNENGYTKNGPLEGGGYGETNYKVEFSDHPDYTMMDIVKDKSAYDFLMRNGHIDKRICFECGNSPIDGTYTFTEPKNLITHNICSDCHPQGGQQSTGGCAGVILFLIFSSVSMIGLYCI
jgi:hypothetical protein